MLILSKTRGLLGALGLAVMSGPLGGCSLVIESRDRQCETDDDCAAFGVAVCDVGAGVCLTPQASGSTGSAGCDDPSGCYACPPTTYNQFLNACTNSPCIPYDNGPLEQYLVDGNVPPVP